MYPTDMGCEDVIWINLASVQIQWPGCCELDSESMVCSLVIR